MFRKLSYLLLFLAMLLPGWSQATPPVVPSSHHVFLVVLENHSFESIFPNGCCSAPPASLTPSSTYPMPYLYQLANQNALAAGYYAESHYSIPNYFWLTAGTQLTFNDNIGSTAADLTAANPITTTNGNVVRSLLANSKTWKAYAESLPYAGYMGYNTDPTNTCFSSGGCTVTTCTSNSCTYVKRHNPFPYFTDVANDATQKLFVVPFTQFATDTAACTTNTCTQLANYSFIVPNLQNDAHNGTLQTADKWLQANIKPFLDSSPVFQPGGDGIMVITFDESFNDPNTTTGTPAYDCRPSTVGSANCPRPASTCATNGCGGAGATGGGYIPAIIIGPGVKKGLVSTTRYYHAHESVMRMMLEAAGVPTPSSYPMGAATADEMGEFFIQTPSTPANQTYTTSYKAETGNNTAAADNWLGTRFNLGYGLMNNDAEAANTSRVDTHTLLYTGNATRIYAHDTPWWTSDNDWSHHTTEPFKTAGSTCTLFTNYPATGTAANGYKPCGAHTDIGVSSELAYQAQRKVTDMMGRGLNGVITDWYGKNSREDFATKQLQIVAEGLGLNAANFNQPFFEFQVMMDGGWYSNSTTNCLGNWNGTTAAAQTNCPDAFAQTGRNITGSGGVSSSNVSCASLPTSTTKTVTADKQTCYLTKMTIGGLVYLNDTYFKSPVYTLANGRPVVTQFSPPASIDWTNISTYMSQVGNPAFLFRNTGGFTHALTAGAFAWVGIVNSTVTVATMPPTDPSSGVGYLNAAGSGFYTVHKGSHPTMIAMGSGWPGFNNHMASWACSATYPNCDGTSSNYFKVTNRSCGQTWLSSMQAANGFYSATSQLPFLQLVTWTDYEEGTEMESGIDNCWSIASSISSHTLNWTLTAVDPDGTGPDTTALATLNSIHHFDVYYTDSVNAADGSVRLALLQGGVAVAETTAGCKCFSLDLSNYKLPSGTYKLYVKLVSQPSIHNSMTSSTGSSYTVTATTNNPPTATVSVSPTSGNAPLTVTATVGGTDSDGSIVSKVINWGDGNTSTVSGTTSSHTYSVANSYSLVLTNTDNGGLTGSATASVQVNSSVVVNPVLTITPNPGNAPLLVTADTTASKGSNGASITSRTIDWGDGTLPATLTTTTKATHTYASFGTYIAILTIHDSAGKTGQTTVTVNVLTPSVDIVTLAAPVDGDFVYVPTRVKARASVQVGPVTKMEILIDGVLVYQVTKTTDPASIDTYVYMNAHASHVITVNAYDGNNVQYSSSVNVLAIRAK